MNSSVKCFHASVFVATAVFPQHSDYTSVVHLGLFYGDP